MKNHRDLSVIIPCYNEEAVLDEMYRRITGVCQSLHPLSYEIILVNDGSKDKTLDIIRNLIQQDSHVVGINLSRNFGHQYALTAGLSICRGNRILIIDADLQDPPELLTEMMAEMDKGADVVYGKRTQREGESWFKRVTAAIFYRLLFRITEVPIPRDTGDFRLISKRINEILKSMPEQHRFIRGMVPWAGYKQVGVPYERDKRHGGQTKYTLKKMVTFSLDAITGFSISPLRIATYFSLGFAALAFASMAYVLYSHIFLDTVPGWASTSFIVSALGAAQLFSLGLVGEYVGRIFMESKKRPIFLIEEIITQQSLNNENDDKDLPER